MLFFLLIPKGFLILNLFHNLIFFMQIKNLLFARNLLFLRFIVNNHLRITYNTLQLRLFAFTEDDSGIYFWKLFWILKSTIIIKSDLRLINWNVSVLPYILSIFNQLVLKFVFEISCWLVLVLGYYVRGIVYCMDWIVILSIFIRICFIMISIEDCWFRLCNVLIRILIKIFI